MRVFIILSFLLYKILKVNNKELKSYVEQNTIGNWVLVVIYAIAGLMILYFLSTKGISKIDRNRSRLR